jgi:hypothetical protein
MHDFCEEIISFTITNVYRAFALISPEFGIDACLLNSRIEKFQYSFMISLTNYRKFFRTKNQTPGKLFNTPESWAKFLPFEYLSAVQGEKVPEGNINFAIFFNVEKHY